MSYVSFEKFARSLRHALRGLRHAMRTEHSFRLHLIVAVVVGVGLLTLQIGRLEKALVILLMANILIMELVNTVVERFVGLLEPRVHSYVGDIKDMMATGVLVLSTAAVIVGLIIFWPAVFG